MAPEYIKFGAINNTKHFSTLTKVIQSSKSKSFIKEFTKINLNYTLPNIKSANMIVYTR